MTNKKLETRQMARDYADRGNPDGWFEEFYARAGGDIHEIYWADLKPNPLLVARIRKKNTAPGIRAITIGCGLGDDAECLAQYGYRVTAFDISASAIDMCRKRYPDSPVAYLVADLFMCPAEWQHGFDLVYECNTIQILTGANRTRAVEAIADLVAPDGELIVS